MGQDDLPEDVQRFLDACIDSVEQLRVLLLLHSQPERDWTTAAITAELRSAETSIAKRLEDLYVRHVLVREPEANGRHRYLPASAEVEAVVRSLAEQNLKRPYRIIEFIYSRPEKALQAFADAFRFGRGGKS